MKKLIIIVSLFTLLLMPSFVFSQTEQMTTGVPPIEQPLIREGDFAVKLVETLKIGTARNEAEAETILSSSGIVPKNGWIADYPVTPDIIGELQTTIGGAADAGKLPINKDEALKAFQYLTGSLGFPVLADTSGSYTGSETRKGYADQTVINNYYYTEGPPVVTYYPPPWDYYYLYSWVPWPFWCDGFHFHGFFVLRHFHRPIFLHNRIVLVTNRVFDPVAKKVFVVDPVRRGTGMIANVETGRTGTSGFNSVDGRRGAASIVERSRARNSGSGNDGMTFRPSTPMGRGEGSVRQSVPDRSTGRDQSGTGGRGSSGSAFSRQGGSIVPRNEMNFQRPSASAERPSSGQGGGIERSFRPPSMSGSGSAGSGRSERTFNEPSRGGGSFSAPFMGHRGSSGEVRSGGPSGGISGGFGGGRESAFHGSSGNRGGGGCRGRC